MTFTTLLFDLDDTLIPDSAVSDEALLVACGKVTERFSVDTDVLKAAFEGHAHRLWHEGPAYAYCHAMGISASEGLWGRFTGEELHLKALREWTPEYRHNAWTRALHDCGVSDSDQIADLVETFAVERRRRGRVYPGVEDTLKRLQVDYRLGLITNGAPDLQREKIDSLSLNSYFEVILVSGEVGIGKPDPGIFHLALERLGESPERAVMIGDNPKRDTLGAHRAGMKGIWVRTAPENRNEEIISDAEIDSVCEIDATLQHLKSQFRETVTV